MFYWLSIWNINICASYRDHSGYFGVTKSGGLMNEEAKIINCTVGPQLWISQDFLTTLD